MSRAAQKMSGLENWATAAESVTAKNGKGHKPHTAAATALCVTDRTSGVAIGYALCKACSARVPFAVGHTNPV